MINRESSCATAPDVAVTGVQGEEEDTKGWSVALNLGVTPSSSTSSGVGDDWSRTGGCSLLIGPEVVVVIIVVFLTFVVFFFPQLENMI